MRYRFPTRPEAPRIPRGFVLPAAIFLIVVMAALGAFMVRISTASNRASAQDVQGARALQAARAGIEAGLYAVRVNGNCPGGTLAGLPGLTGFRVVWSCTSSPFTDAGVARTLWRIESTACYTAGNCPAGGAEIADGDYTERQLVVVTER
ncbi:MAG: hypothetical protein REI09_14120 [Candidatus Dactylopiibacterium sp.]|nr:hypothetical protein [Candidatus Dactylopiibacterium sp.]